MSSLAPPDTFPATIEGTGSAADFFAANKGAVDTALAREGAVLLRGFDMPDAQAFDDAVEAYGEDGFTYDEPLSNAVRVNVTPRVFTANEAPPEAGIYLHHEMAQTPIYPSKLFFYCELPAETGGETPLCRSDCVADALAERAPVFVDQLAELGVRYRHTMPGDNNPNSGQGRSWKSTLSVGDRASAEAKLGALGYEWHWSGDGALAVTTPVLAALRTLSDGSRSFFNQLIAAWRGWAADPDAAARSITYGDDSPIAAADMAVAVELGEAFSHDLSWQAGDIALVDNYRVMHGRRPFTGKRRVLASLIA